MHLWSCFSGRKRESTGDTESTGYLSGRWTGTSVQKIMDGRSINKINGETSTVGQMKAAAACLLDIHGQHEHQSLLYQDKQLAILDAYGKEKSFLQRRKYLWHIKNTANAKQNLVP